MQQAVQRRGGGRGELTGLDGRRRCAGKRRSGAAAASRKEERGKAARGGGREREGGGVDRAYRLDKERAERVGCGGGGGGMAHTAVTACGTLPLPNSSWRRLSFFFTFRFLSKKKIETGVVECWYSQEPLDRERAIKGDKRTHPASQLHSEFLITRWIYWAKPMGCQK